MIVRRLNIALVAHDGMKIALSKWVAKNKSHLKEYRFYATGTTCKVLSEQHSDLDITPLKSGPLGGDQQLGALICEGRLDGLIFFQDPMASQPHDVDVKALVRMSTLYNIALACNPVSADLMITNPDFLRITLRNCDEAEKKWESYMKRSLPHS